MYWGTHEVWKSKMRKYDQEKPKVLTRKVGWGSPIDRRDKEVHGAKRIRFNGEAHSQEHMGILDCVDVGRWSKSLYCSVWEVKQGVAKNHRQMYITMSVL